MKIQNKFLYVLIAVFMVVILAACGSPAEEAAPVEEAASVEEVAPVEEEAAAEGDSLYAEDGRYPTETVKICMITFDPADTTYIGIQDYLNSLSEELFNVEFIYSEKIESAEQELQFIENCGAAGAQGFIAYYNVSLGQAIAKTSELGIYYWGMAEQDDVYEAFKNDPYYLGSITSGNSDYDGMYGVTKAVIEQGGSKFIYANGGADFGVPLFIQRKGGFEAAIDEANAAGAEITVEEVSGFPNEDWFAAQGAALAGDVDAVIGSFGADVWVQPIASAGKTDEIIVGSFGAMTEFYQQTFGDGSVSAIAAEPTEKYGIAVAQIINAVDGNADALEVDGAATNASQTLWIVTENDAFTTLYDFENGNGRKQYSEGLIDLIVNLNPDASVATVEELIDAYSLDAVMAK